MRYKSRFGRRRDRQLKSRFGRRRDRQLKSRFGRRRDRQLKRRLEDLTPVVLVLVLVLAGWLAGAATLLLAQILRERSACLEDSAVYAGTCILEQDGWLEYHYYFYPTTHVEAQEDASTYDDSEDTIQDSTSPLQAEFGPNNGYLI